MVYTILCFVFLTTTLDSSVYVLASVCSKNLIGDDQPARWNRSLWALPLIVIMALQTLSLLKWLKEDFNELDPKVLAIDYKPAEKANG